MAMTGQRLFFGIGLQQAASQQLQHWQAASLTGGRSTHPRDLHLTLAFLGPVDATQLATLVPQVEQLPLPPAFTLEFSRLSHWLRAGILCLTTGQVPGALQQLHQQLALLAATHLGRPPERRPFVPHITLARGLYRRLDAYPAPPRVQLQIRGFGLYRSRPEQPPPHYDVLHHWTLT